MLLIGITGKAHAGKDTVADMIARESTSRQIAFASPIKEAFKAIFGFHPDDFSEGKEAQVPGFDFTIREALQTLGTEWGRNLQHDIWLQIALNKYHGSLVFPYKYVLITDVRFDNEADLIRANNGIVVEVRRTAAETVAAHSSENGLTDKADFTLCNDGTLEQLEEKVKEMLSYV